MEKVQEDEVLKSVCSFNGKTYESGESWVHQAECSECNCYHGVVSCKPIQCDLHESCTLVRAEPGSAAVPLAGALDGVRVLDLTDGLAGPVAGMLLGDLGADVVRVGPSSGGPVRLKRMA